MIYTSSPQIPLSQQPPFSICQITTFFSFSSRDQQVKLMFVRHEIFLRKLFTTL